MVSSVQREWPWRWIQIRMEYSADKLHEYVVGPLRDLDSFGILVQVARFD